LPQAAIQAALAGQGGAKDSQGPMNGDYPYAVPQMPAYTPPSTGRMVLGGIGDALQQWSGGQPTFGPEMQRQRQYAQALQAAQMQRAQQFADQKALYAWKQANPAPTQFEQDLRAAGIDPASPQGRQLYQQKVANAATAPPIVQRNADGTSTIYPAGSIPRGGAATSAGPAVGAVDGGYRFKGGNPADPNAWEPVSGGAPSQGGATFP
jgi:hypothetical protein